MRRKILGRQAEKTAIDFLRRKGFKLVDRNFSCRLGEIDIVAKDKDEIVFVEVRSAKGYSFHDPLESITQRKIGRLQKLALVWIYRNQQAEVNFRFDVIAVVFLEGGDLEVRHIKNAF